MNPNPAFQPMLLHGCWSKLMGACWHELCTIPFTLNERWSWWYIVKILREPTSGCPWPWINFRIIFETHPSKNSGTKYPTDMDIPNYVITTLYRILTHLEVLLLIFLTCHHFSFYFFTVLWRVIILLNLLWYIFLLFLCMTYVSKMTLSCQ